MIPLHVAVRDRARLEVAGLYRSPGIKQHLEQALAAAGFVRSVEASTLTDRMLVIFDPGIPVAGVITLIEDRFNRKPQPKGRRNRPKRLSQFRIYGH